MYHEGSYFICENHLKQVIFKGFFAIFLNIFRTLNLAKSFFEAFIYLQYFFLPIFGIMKNVSKICLQTLATTRPKCSKSLNLNFSTKIAAFYYGIYKSKMIRIFYFFILNILFDRLLSIMLTFLEFTNSHIFSI
jgi:hypothetical protein